MKHILKNKTNRFIFFLIITTITAILITLFFPTITAAKKASAASLPAFVKKYQTLSVNQKVQYKIKNLKKSDSVYFTISNSTLASIGKKSGWLIPKRTGQITVKATIYNNKHKKRKTLSNKIVIQEKKKILPNASFKVKENINPWNFTISLSCSRILLKSEINTDKLTILPKGKKTPKLSASFSSLSDDGRDITYTLNSGSRSKLCPGDFSMDGEYILQSLHFSKKLSISYKERLTKNTLSGFVLSTDGKSVKNALVSLKKNHILIKQCYTDKDGYYRLPDVSDGTSLTIEKSGFQKNTILNPAISSKGTTCENVILQPSKDTETAIECFVTDSENNPIPDTPICIFAENMINSNSNHDFPSKEKMIFQGNTDSSGKLVLTNTTDPPSLPCSTLSIGDQSQLTYSSDSEIPSSSIITLSPAALNSTEYFTIYINSFSPIYKSSGYNAKKISFSLSDFMTNYISLHVKLEKNPDTCIKNLTIFCDNSPILFRSLRMQFFSPGCHESFFQHSIDKNNLNIDGNQITLSSQLLPIALSDGTFYFNIQALSEENKIISESPITAFQVKNGIIDSQPILLTLPRHARILTYGQFDTDPVPATGVSLALFQKCDTNYFLKEIIYSEKFAKQKENFSIANLYLNNLVPRQEYLLLPLSGTIEAKKYISLSVTEENTFPAKENAVYSIAPIAQIDCTLHSDSNSKPDSALNYINVPDFFNTDVINNINAPHCISYNITQNFIRSRTTYPNCIIAFYQTDGTLLSTTLTMPPADPSYSTQQTAENTASVHPQSKDSTLLHSENASIIDIYTNKKILVTNVSSNNYRK